MKTWSKVQEAGPSQFRPHFDLSWTNHEGSDLFLYHQKVVNNWENRYGLPPSGDVKNVTSNVLPEAPVDETTFRGKHYNQSLPLSNLSKTYKNNRFIPFVRSCRIRWALLLALLLCRICKSGLRHKKAVRWISLILFGFFNSVSDLLLGLILTGLERMSLTGVEQLLDEYSRVSSSKQSSFKNTCNVAKLLD